MALTKISTAMISQSASAVDLNIDAGTLYVDATNNRVGVGGKTDPATPLHVTGTVTATLFAGSGASLTGIPNGALTNSSITINSSATSLGGSITLTTANIAENTNLYYTNARADARIAAADTNDLSEGSSNLYYTDARVNARVAGGSLGNITTTGYIRGPATFTIDPATHGDNTGTVVIAGNLQVDGTQTTINSTTLTVDDKNITLASGSANASAASGAGFTVDIGSGTNPSITYDGTNDEWDFNKPLNVTGTGKFSGDVGVGATPTARLDVRRGDASGKIAEFHQNAGYGIDIGSSQAVAYISSGYNQRLDFKTDPTSGQTERMSILANGNVGIGTISPNNKLDVDFSITGEGSQEGGIKIQNARGYNNDIAPLYFGVHGGTRRTKAAIGLKREGSYGIGSLIFALDSNGDDANVTFANDEKMRITTAGNVHLNTGVDARVQLGTSGTGASSVSDNSVYVRGNDDDLILGAAGNGNISFKENTSTHMFIKTGGNVGINDTNPTTTLTVGGIVQIKESSNTAFYGANYVRMFGDQNYYFKNTGGATRALISMVDGDLNLYNSSTALTNRISTNSDSYFNGGNVGIGTNSPAQKLEIEGDVRIKDARSLFFKRHGDNYAWRIRNESAQDTSTYGFDGTNSLVFEVVSNSNTNATPAVGSHSVYSSSANTLVLKETGRVGIGIASPAHPLHITKELAGYQAYFNNDNGSAQGIKVRIKSNDSGNFNMLELVSASTGSDVTAMVVRDDGNVGIGTPSPDYNLHVVGTAHVSATLSAGALTIPSQGMIFNQAFGTGVPSITMTGTANNGRGGAIQFKESNGSGGNIADTAAIYSTDGAGGNASYGGLTIAAYQSDIRFSTGTLAGTKMLVRADGNVGIGTTLPNSRLMVIDTTDARKQIEFSNHATYRGSIGHDAGSGFNEYRTEADGGKHAFYRGATSTTPEMVIDNNGKVGIGTAVPASLLDVGGGLIADPVVRIDSAAGGDPSLVFDTGAANRSATIKFHDNGSTAAGFIDYVHNGDKMNFGAGSTTGVTMTVNDGKVGIQTEDPQAGLHAANGGILLNGTINNSMSSYHGSNIWTFIYTCGTSGTYNGSLRVNVPDCDNSASSQGYGGFSMEVYIAGYNGKYCHAFLSGYVNTGITLSESAIRASNGGWSVSYGSVGLQGFYFDINYPSGLIHPSAYIRITKGGHTTSTSPTNMAALSTVWT